MCEACRGRLILYSPNGAQSCLSTVASGIVTPAAKRQLTHPAIRSSGNRSFARISKETNETFRPSFRLSGASASCGSVWSGSSPLKNCPIAWRVSSRAVSLKSKPSSKRCPFSLASSILGSRPRNYCWLLGVLPDFDRILEHRLSRRGYLRSQKVSCLGWAEKRKLS